jgi:hypothetical protein
MGTHARENERPFFAARLEGGQLLQGELFGPTEVHAPRFGFVNPIELPLGAQFRLELRNRPQHIEQ